MTQGPFGGDNRAIVLVSFYAQPEPELLVLMVTVEFSGTSQDEIYRWITRLLEAGRDFQQTLLPTEHPIDYADVEGTQFRGEEEWPIEWRMMASLPGRVLHPPFDDQGKKFYFGE